MINELTATVYIDNGPPFPGKLVESQHIDYVTSALPRPNPAWTYTDENGHFHAYDHSDERDRYPTLRRHVVHVECEGTHDPDDEDCGGHNQTWYLCRICEEVILPGLLHGTYTTPIPGLKDWTVTVDMPEPCRSGFGDQVSVRVETLWAVYFGVAVMANQTMSGGAVELELLGNGPLGSRKRSAPPCPVCGALVRIERIDVSTLKDHPRKVYVLGGETRCTASALHDVAEVALAWANGGDQ